MKNKRPKRDRRGIERRRVTAGIYPPRAVEMSSNRVKSKEPSGGGPPPPPRQAAGRKALGAPSQAEMKQVHKLREQGKTYVEIEKELGWPDAHGGRVWYLLNVPRAYSGRSGAPKRSHKASGRRR